ncbi:hypothetical protein O6H91_04G079500 [Diphasiastrum complanatum]|uniref:Uncharacterized protein n=1 Tax=Diphasiastrum complanatum TaxID=34168 RepID=A0ACC2DYU0_DIPCM|nr:hypothetical protein O6H91_04G079500 [Diphasiastrum complanatum]
MTTIEDVEELVSKLLSDRTRVREEGLKLLNSYLEVVGNQSFCTLLDNQTVLLQQQERIHSSTWPGVLHALCQCISMEVALSKKRGPKSFLSKTLRTFVQKAEDHNRSGHKLLLLRKMKKLFHHLSETVRDASSFVSDYGQILCQLLPDIEYRLCLSKKTYTDLFHFFLEKVKSVAHKDAPEHSITKEEAFRLALTLLSLVQHPPGDIPDLLRSDIVDGYCDIFSHLRDDGRIAKKLIAAVNTTLINDGLNLGDSVVKIHSSFRHFLVRTWLTTRDWELKDGLVLYLRAQLNLRRIIASRDCGVLQELLELIEKELDHTGAFLAGCFRDDKPGCLSKSSRSFFELAATVLFEVGAGSKVYVNTKRRRKESVDLVIKDRLMNGNSLWCSAFSFLIRRFGFKFARETWFSWLEAIALNLERLFSDAVNTRAFQSSIWTLRCLQELSALWRRAASNAVVKKHLQQCTMEDGKLWQSVWDALFRWLPLFNPHPSMVEESFRLLGDLAAQGVVPCCNVPPDFWDLQYFTEHPHSNTLYFVAMYFARYQIQVVFGDAVRLRKSLLRCALTYLDALGVVRPKVFLDDRVSPKIFSAAVLAICTGSFKLPSKDQFSAIQDSSLADDLDDWLEPEEHDRGVEACLATLDWSKRFNNVHEGAKENLKLETRFNVIPFSTSDKLLQDLVNILQEKVKKALDSNDLITLLKMSTVLIYCISGVMYSGQRRGQLFSDWEFQEKVKTSIENLLDHFITVVNGLIMVLEDRTFELMDKTSATVVDVAQQLSSTTVSNMNELVAVLVGSSFMCQESSLCSRLQNLMRAFNKMYLAVVTFSQTDTTRSATNMLGVGSHDSTFTTRILDADLDVSTDASMINVVPISNSADASLGIISVSAAVLTSCQWRRNCISMMSSLGKLLPELAHEKFKTLLLIEKDEKLYGEVFRSVCHSVTSSSLVYLPDLVEILKQMLQRDDECGQTCAELLTTIDILLSRLLSLKKTEPANNLTEMPQNVILQIAKMVEEIADMSLILWTNRAKVAQNISSLLVLDPDIAQTLTEKFVRMLHDPEYQVRLLLSRLVPILFETWSGHSDLFQDVCSNFGMILPMATKWKVVCAPEVCQPGAENDTFGVTVILTLGEIAAGSEVVESEALFMILGYAALHPSHRSLAAIVLDKLSYRLGYPDRFKYLEHLAGGIFSRWVRAKMPLSALVEMRELFAEKIEPKEFIQNCNSLLLPHLLLQGHEDELMWLAKANSIPIPCLLREHFASIFASVLPLHCSQSLSDREKAAQVLQGSMLASAEITEDKRDHLIKKQMVSIISIIFSLCSSSEEPEIPFFSKAAVTLAVRTVVDGFMETDEVSEDGGVIDKMHIFRSDRVFMLLLQVHYQIDAAYHPRHRCHYLARLGAFIDVIRNRILVPSTWRYFVHIVLDSIEFKELQVNCCELLGEVIDRMEHLSSETAAWMLGSQLQSIVSRLVSCCLDFYTEKTSVIKSTAMQNNKMSSGNKEMKRFSSVVALLNRVTTEADHSLYPYVKELEPFPAFPTFKQMEALRLELRSDITLKDEFLQFVHKANDLSPSLRVKSLQRLYHQLKNAKAENVQSWLSDAKVIVAVWKLVRLCKEHDGDDFHSMAGDFLASVGISDPNAVIFHLPEDPEKSQSIACSSSRPESGKSTSASLELDQGTGDDLVMNVLVHLRAYLLDKAVHIIDLTVNSLKGILATETGHRVFRSLNDKDRAYMEVYSNGVNLKLVEDMLDKRNMDIARKAMVLEDCSLWKTSGKSYQTWICNLTCCLIQCTNDPIFQLCEELALQKAPLAELLFPHVLKSLSRKLHIESDGYKQIAEKVQKYIFDDSNKSTRAIQIWLETLNFLRQAYVKSKLREHPVSAKRDGVKQGKKTIIEEKSRSISSADSDSLQIGALEHEEQHYNSPITWPKVYWLQIDYLLTAKAAQQCGAYFTSALYVEQWCKENFGHLTLGEPDFSSDLLPWHMELLLNVYTRINEPDGVYGVIQSHKLISQLRMYEHEGNWNKALENYDLLLRSIPHSAEKLSSAENLSTFHEGRQKHSTTGRLQTLHFMKGLLRSLHQMGCSHVSEMYCHGLVKEQVGMEDDIEFKELQSEAAWRSGNWDLNFSAPTLVDDSSYSSRELSVNYNAMLHSCFRSLVDGDEQMFHVQIKETKKELVTFLERTSLESTQNVHPAIIRLQILNVLSRAWGMRWPTTDSSISFADPSESHTRTSGGPIIPSDEQMINLTSSWEDILKQTRSNYDLLEPAATFFSVLFQVLGQKDVLTSHLLQFATLARKAGRLNQAATAAHQLKFLSQEKTALVKDSNVGSSQLEHKNLRWCTALQLQEAKILWAQGQHEMAVNLAKYILQSCDIERDSAAVHCLTGKWLAETRSASSHTILEGYLQKAVEVAKETNTSSKQKCKTYYHLAHYTDALYRSYEDQLTSNEWQSALRLRQHKARELEALIKRLKNASKDDKRDYTLKALELQKQLSMDNEQAQRLQDDKENFLMIALESYRNCLTTSDKYDIRVVFRIISLWFNLSCNPMVNASMLETVKVVQAFKFLPLMYQIASRLSTPKDIQVHNSFQSAVTFLVKKMAIEHPYHTLYQLLALAKGDRVKDKQRSKSVFIVDLEKKAAAENLLNELLAYHPDVIQQMKQMIEMYIRLAELETKKEDTNKRLPVPRDIRSIRQLELVPVITAPLSVDPSSQYKPGTFPHFKGLSDRIIVMNGINAPKVIECLGSDGCRYRQLAKSGNDDLRQDAVMEQLFGLVNKLLQDHPDTKKRELRIRTYKVIPFTPSAGVLEWVDGTIPLGEYLLGSTRTGGAHARYGDGDWTFMKCREYMSAETDKRKAFQTVCRHFRPVMHLFFLERFGQPADWFEKRLAYTRSVATSSMVGYIVGLGDRHSMNILIDQASAEVVHIDFGVAFEQGLMLKTPERVPFRLTGDIVDGMGVSGIEGVFRRCCEATLSVMRANKEALLTIIEVFIHDPLYKWALSPLKALQRQQETDDLDDDESSEANGSPENVEGNKDATRALLRVKQKLDGYEQGEMRSLQGQVQQLIQDAQDPEHLAQMFPGWGAWL